MSRCCGDIHECVLLRMWESDSQLAHSLNAMPSRGCVENVCILMLGIGYIFLFLYCIV